VGEGSKPKQIQILRRRPAGLNEPPEALRKQAGPIRANPYAGSRRTWKPGGGLFLLPGRLPRPPPPLSPAGPSQNPTPDSARTKSFWGPNRPPPPTASPPASLPAPTAAPTPLPRGPACATALAPPASPPAAHCRLSPGSGPQPLRSKPSSSSSRPSSPQSRARRRAGCRPPESIGSSSCVFAGVRVARVARCASSPLSPSMTRACGGAAPRARYDCLPGP
jgi:hypothetical protein